MDVCEVAKADLDELALFLCSVFNGTSIEIWRERFTHLWDNNPAFVQNANRGFVFKENGSIIAFIGRFPTWFHIKGNVTLASNGFGLSVLPEYRRYKLASRLREAHLESGIAGITFATTPSPITKIINTRYGFIPIPRGFETSHEIITSLPISRLKLINYFAYCFVKYNKRSAISILKSALSPRQENTANTDYVFKLQREVGPEFDGLWERSKSFFQYTNVRTSDVINWYLTPMKSASSKHVFCCYSGNGDLLGYALFAVNELKEKNITLFTQSYCCDFWIDWNRGFPFKEFIDFIVRISSTMGQDIVILPHFNKYFSRFITKNYTTTEGLPGNDFFRGPEDIIGHVTNDNSYFSSLQGDSRMF